MMGRLSRERNGRRHASWPPGLTAEPDAPARAAFTCAGASGSADTFRPLPFLGNPHVQTLLGTLWRGTVPFFASQQWCVPLPDGDRLVVHDSTPSRWLVRGRIVVLVHGLGGSHASGYMERMTVLLLARGVRVLRVDLRGCGQGTALARRTYNGACSPDVRAVAEEIQRREP